jgi:hypothetical protein
VPQAKPHTVSADPARDLGEPFFARTPSQLVVKDAHYGAHAAVVGFLQPRDGDARRVPPDPTGCHM